MEKKKGGWKVWHTFLLIGGILMMFFVIVILIVVLAVVGFFSINKKATMEVVPNNQFESEYEYDDDYDESGMAITEEPDYGRVWGTSY